MNKLKLFDKCQLLIAIIGVSAMIISSILFIVMVLTGTIVRDESGAITEIVYNNVVQTIFSIFFLMQITSIIWFVTRIATYKMRVKEEDAQ